MDIREQIKNPIGPTATQCWAKGMKVGIGERPLMAGGENGVQLSDAEQSVRNLAEQIAAKLPRNPADALLVVEAAYLLVKWASEAGAL